MKSELLPLFARLLFTTEHEVNLFGCLHDAGKQLFFSVEIGRDTPRGVDFFRKS